MIMTAQTITGSISYLSDDTLLIGKAASMALSWLNSHLKSADFAETDKAENLAEALGRFFFRLLSLDTEESVRAGDITVRKDSEKLLKAEKLLLDAAIESSADILKDGEFFFEAR